MDSSGRQSLISLTRAGGMWKLSSKDRTARPASGLDLRWTKHCLAGWNYGRGSPGRRLRSPSSAFTRSWFGRAPLTVNMAEADFAMGEPPSTRSMVGYPFFGPPEMVVPLAGNFLSSIGGCACIPRSHSALNTFGVW